MTMTKLNAALIRAGRTVAQSALAAIGSTQLIEGVDWKIVASTSGLAGVVSLLTSAATDLPEVSAPEA
jgi:hypothetical protein